MGISVTQLLIILAIVVLLFGTKRLKNIGTDLGSAIRGFKSSVKDGEESDNTLVEKNDEDQGLQEQVTIRESEKV